MSVLKNGERILVEVGNEALLVIKHGGVQHDFFDALLEHEPAIGGVRGLWGSLRGRLAARSRSICGLLRGGRSARSSRGRRILSVVR
jgi:hypothetical protein